MARVLIVEDVHEYRRQLEIALAADDHEVASAGDGRDAIDSGARFRPQVLVTDWMLNDDIHGLHVSEAVRAMTPEVQTILLTGFATEDLRTDAVRHDVAAFIEKPFSLDTIRRAVRTASAAPPPRSTRPPIAVLEADEAGNILFVNPRARELLSETDAGAEAATLGDLFAPEQMAKLPDGIDCWIPVTPRAAHPMVWQFRAQAPRAGGSRLIVLRHQDDPRFLTGSTIDMLLGVRSDSEPHWPLPGRVLVVSDDAVSRRMAVSMLENAGAGCNGSAVGAQALRLLQNDEGIDYIILDCQRERERLAGLAAEMRAARSDVTIIACHSGTAACPCAAYGVAHILPKPWRAEALINALTGRLGRCDECGMLLPLRRARGNETAQPWTCRGCGTRYTAVWDEALAAEAGANVAPVN